jgi:hypothetical protein
MPGYLGSEKQFIRRYQKPLIASSRDRDLEHGRNKKKQSNFVYLNKYLIFRTISNGCFT